MLAYRHRGSTTMSGQKRHRLFIAINLPYEIKRQLAQYQEQFKELPAKWTEPENLHITLVFLGEVSDEEMGNACVIAKQVAERHSSFNVQLTKISYGPDNKIPPKMVWAIGEKSKELSALRQDLEDALLEKIVFAPETRALTPHITLARVQAAAWRIIEPEERPEIDRPIELSFTVESIEVMESELKRGGPVYTVVESAAFKEHV